MKVYLENFNDLINFIDLFDNSEKENILNKLIGNNEIELTLLDAKII